MDKVATALREVYAKDLATLPVSKDLPRLCKKIAVLTYNASNSSYDVKKFTADATEQIVYNLLLGISKELYKVSSNVGTDPLVSLEPSTESFTQEVNIQVHESLTQYLVKYWGEHSRLCRILKSLNQSFVIATLVHIRMALMGCDIQFKDCRGDNWFLEVCLGKDGAKPSVVQRRKEQVFKMADNGLPQNLYVFTWEVIIDFDSLECLSVTDITIRWLGTDFSNVSEKDVPPQQRQEIEEKFKNVFTNLTVKVSDFKLN